MLSVARSSQRVRARSRTPRPLRFSVWLPPSVCNTSVTASPSSAATPRRPRMLPYVLSYPLPYPDPSNIPLERIRRYPRQACLRDQGPEGRCPQASCFIHAQVDSRTRPRSEVGLIFPGISISISKAYPNPNERKGVMVCHNPDLASHPHFLMPMLRYLARRPQRKKSKIDLTNLLSPSTDCLALCFV